MRAWSRVLGCLVVVGLCWTGCTDPPPPVPGAAEAPRAAPSPAPTAPTAPAAAPVIAAPAGPTLDEAAFKEGELSRDPFRRLLDRPPEDQKILCYRGKLLQYGLDELRLTGIVGGGTRPQAMLRGPATDSAVTIQRGDRISKTCGQVKAILRDRVIVTIRVEGSGQQAERVLPLHTS